MTETNRQEDFAPKEMRFGMIAVEKASKKIDIEDVLHFVGFFDEPSESDYKAIREELETFPEFGLVGTEFDLIPSPPEIFDFYKNAFDNPGNFKS